MRFAAPALTFATFALDRLTKAWVQGRLAYGETVEVLPFFQLTYLENTGAAFGLGQNLNRLFIGVALAILAFLFVYSRRIGFSTPAAKLALALVIGGALGNLYDRIVYGSVVDFLDFYIGGRHWPAFNVADSAICVGAGVLAFCQWKKRQPDAAGRPR